jgi:hypothetical protein
VTELPIDLVLLGLALWVPLIIIPSALSLVALTNRKRGGGRH